MSEWWNPLKGRLSLNVLRYECEWLRGVEASAVGGDQASITGHTVFVLCQALIFKVSFVLLSETLCSKFLVFKKDIPSVCLQLASVWFERSWRYLFLFYFIFCLAFHGLYVPLKMVGCSSLGQLLIREMLASYWQKQIALTPQEMFADDAVVLGPLESCHPCIWLFWLSGDLSSHWVYVGNYNNSCYS